MFAHELPLRACKNTALYVQEPPKNLQQQNSLLIFSRGDTMALKSEVWDVSLPGVCPQPEVSSQLLDITMHQLSIKIPTLSHPQSMRN